MTIKVKEVTKLQLLYKSCKTCLTNHMGSISCHTMLLVINSLKGTHTHIHTHTHAHTHTDTHTDLKNKSNFKKPGVCWPLAATYTLHT